VLVFQLKHYETPRSEESAVDSTVIVCRLGGGCGVRIPAGDKRFFYLRKRSDQLWGPPSLLFGGYRGFYLGV